jgi:hypothetical protein
MAILLPIVLKEQRKKNKEQSERVALTFGVDKSSAPKEIQEGINKKIAELRLRHNENLENFKIKNEIKIIKNTNSTLGLCGVNDDTLFYQIMYSENTSWEMQPYNIISKNVKCVNGVSCFKIEGIDRVFTEPILLLEPYKLAAKPIEAKTIPLDRIECWNEEGGTHTREKISNRLAGATVGTLMFGGLGGALLGTALAGKETETIDNRKLVLYVRTPSGQLTKEIIARGNDGGFNYFETCSAIKALLPNKKYKYEMFEDNVINDYQTKGVSTTNVINNSDANQTDNSTFTNVTAENLKQLKGLLDAGIITQEEFDAKKKQLLGL